MKLYISKALALSSLFFFLICQPLVVLSEPLVMETLDYSVAWMGVDVGKARLEVFHDNGEVKIITVALSNDWVSKFYKVENTIESILDSEGYPLHYKVKLHQGDRTRDREVFFDYKSKVIKSIDNEKNKERIFKMVKKYHDPLSGFFELRRRDITVGTTEIISIFDKKKFYDAHVEILRKERIETNYGQYDTIVVHPKLETDGIFTSKTDITMWVTDNEEKIPVKIQAEIKIGTVIAYLKGER